MTHSRRDARVRLPERALLASAIALICAPAVHAQQPTGAQQRASIIEEITVTAQRREESVQDVPIAVSAFSGAMLEDRQIINPSDLQMNAPNVSFTSTNFGGNSFSIRGIGNLVIAASGESGVSTHINEIPIGTNLTAIEFFDMERVEILRGPQGTLFGRNATGGAINFVTARPDPTAFDAHIDAELGDYSHKRLKGAINIPITDTFAIRAAGMWLDRDGYTKNLAFNQQQEVGIELPLASKRVDGRDLWAGRLTAEWAISDRTNLYVMYSRFDESSNRARITNQICVTNPLPTTGCDPDAFGFEMPHLGSTTGGIFGGTAGALPLGVTGTEENFPGLNFDFPRPDNMGLRTMHTDFEPIYESKEDVFTFGLDHQTDRYSFSLQGAYQETDFLSQQDYVMNVGATLNPTAQNPSGLWPTSRPAGRAGGDWMQGPCNINDGNTGVEGGCILPIDQTRVFAFDQASSKSDYWTIEGKVASAFEGPFNFVLGASAYSAESHGDYYVLANTLDLVTSFGSAFLGAPPLYPGYFNNTSNPSGGVESDGYAFFGEGYYQATENLKFTLGLRYNRDEKETSDTSVLFNAIDLNAALGGALGPGRFWTRTIGFLFGDPTDVALGNLYAPELVAAAQGTPPLSPERFAVSAAVPIVPQFGETRTLTGSPSEVTFKEWSGRLGFDWQVSNDSMIYAFFSRGYKPGGFNPAIPPAFQATSSFTFEPEKINAFEVGSKNVLMDGSLVLNGAAFFYDYKGLQVTRIANNSSLNDNIDADIYGLELEAMWRPQGVPGLSVDAAYSFLKTKVGNELSVDPVNRVAGEPDMILLNNIDPGSLTAVNYVARESQITQTVVDNALASNAALTPANGGTAPGTNVTYAPNAAGVEIPAYFSRNFLAANGIETSDGFPTNLNGNALPNSPEHSIRLGLAYTWPVSALSGSLTARYDYYWQGKMFAREFNTPGDRISSWDQHNASLIYESDDGRWTMRAFVRNIADKDNITGKYLTSDTSGFYRNYFLTEPRIFGASVRYSFSGTGGGM
jgi:iron complex outermembrane receptor protein